MHASGAGLEELGNLIDEGKLQVTIDRTFPLESAKDALAYLETGRAKGKVVLRAT
jgi:alcohol dehydrogenase